MATRRNRIKAVINVPRGGRPSAATSDRPLTPANLNLVHPPVEPVQPEPSLSPVPLSPCSPYQLTHPPGSPVKQVDRGKSPSLYLPPSSSLLRSLSPSPSKLVPSQDLPSLSLVKSPGPPPPPTQGSPRQDRRPVTPGSYGSLQSPPYTGSVDSGLRSPPYPFSPPSVGTLQRPSPTQSPAAFSQQYSTAPATNPSSRVGGLTTWGRERPSPVTSPSFERHQHQPSPEIHRQGTPLPVTSLPFVAPHAFNTNSNSADSHEVAKFMSSGSPASQPPLSPSSNSNSSRGESGQRGSTPGFGGAFASVVKDQQKQDHLLRQRLQNPSAAITVSKYHTLRKEFMTKVNHTITKEEQGKLSMLHFAFWNPPKPEGRGPRSRASSVCSDRGRHGAKSSFSDGDPNSRHSFVEMDSSKTVTRRATIDTVNLLSPSPQNKEDEDLKRRGSDAESTASQSSNQTSIGPRVKVGPDGQLIIDEQSLVVETSESIRAKKQLSEMETVSGADFAVGSSGLFRNKKQIKRGTDWTIRETVKFYKGLSLCGTDFSMMATIFPNRTRAELKSKFKREDRRNPSQISLALSCQEFDPDEGITSDEEEDVTVPDVAKKRNSDNAKSKNKVSNDKTIIYHPSGNPEQDKLLLEEMEEERTTTFCISGASTSPKCKSKAVKQPKLEKTEKPLKKGRPVDPWKSIQVVPGLNPTELKTPEGGLKKVKTEKSKGVKTKITNARRRPRTKKIRNDEADSPDREPPRKRGRPIKKRRKSAQTSKRNSKTSGLPPLQLEYDFVAQNPEVDRMDSLDILRFDASDPLGLKVVPIRVHDSEVLEGGTDTAPPTSTDIVTLTTVKSSGGGSGLSRLESVSAKSAASQWNTENNSNIPIDLSRGEDGPISPRSFAKNFDSAKTNDNLVNNIGVNVKSERDSLAKKMARPQAKKVKVLPYRVPGPGGGTVRSPSRVDEIEIEISCQ